MSKNYDNEADPSERIEAAAERLSRRYKNWERDYVKDLLEGEDEPPFVPIEMLDCNGQK